MPDTTNQEPGDFLTTTEAAQLLGVSVRTLQRYETAGRINPDRLPSGHRRYRREDVIALRTPARRTAAAGAA